MRCVVFTEDGHKLQIPIDIWETICAQYGTPIQQPQALNGLARDRQNPAKLSKGKARGRVLGRFLLNGTAIKYQDDVKVEYDAASRILTINIATPEEARDRSIPTSRVQWYSDSCKRDKTDHRIDIPANVAKTMKIKPGEPNALYARHKPSVGAGFFEVQLY
jgi:hypothetical protein